MVRFDNQVVIVTGGGRGIGRAYCLELARRGASVVVNDLAAEFAEQVAETIRAEGGKAATAVRTVATREGAQGIVADALDAFGTVDAVINNAGYMRNGYLEDLTTDMLEAMLDVHIRGSFYVTQAAWPVLRDKGRGRVVMIGSAGGMFAMQAESNYALAKAGVYGLAKALAVEGERHGILVNTVMPMATNDDPDASGRDTETLRSFRNVEAVPGYAERYPAGIREALAPRRLPEAVAPFVAFLVSDACDVSGHTYSVGFGRYARVFVGEAQGWVAPNASEVTLEDVIDHLDEVRDLEGYAVPGTIYDEVNLIAARLGVAPAI